MIHGRVRAHEYHQPRLIRRRIQSPRMENRQHRRREGASPVSFDRNGNRNPQIRLSPPLDRRAQTGRPGRPRARLYGDGVRRERPRATDRKAGHALDLPGGQGRDATVARGRQLPPRPGHRAQGPQALQRPRHRPGRPKDMRLRHLDPVARPRGPDGRRRQSDRRYPMLQGPRDPPREPCVLPGHRCVGRGVHHGGASSEAPAFSRAVGSLSVDVHPSGRQSPVRRASAQALFRREIAYSVGTRPSRESLGVRSEEEDNG